MKQSTKNACYIFTYYVSHILVHSVISTVCTYVLVTFTQMYKKYSISMIFLTFDEMRADDAEQLHLFYVILLKTLLISRKIKTLIIHFVLTKMIIQKLISNNKM